MTETPEPFALASPEPSDRRLRRQRPLRVVQQGEHLVSTGGWQSRLAIMHLEWHLERYAAAPPKKWCLMACLGKTMFQRQTAANTEATRKRIGRLFLWALLQDPPQVIAISYDDHPGGHGRILAVKLYEGGDERAHAVRQAERMHRIGALKDRHYQLMLTLLNEPAGPTINARMPATPDGV